MTTSRTKPNVGDHVRFLAGPLADREGTWTREDNGAISVTLANGSRVFNPSAVEVVAPVAAAPLVKAPN